jgi:hypothetical protein
MLIEAGALVSCTWALDLLGECESSSLHNKTFKNDNRYSFKSEKTDLIRPFLK